MKRIGTWIALVAILTTTAAQAAGWDDIVAAAKREGKVSLYTVNGGSACYNQNLAAFKAETGIDVQVLSGRGTELQERITTEQTTSHYIADVSWNGPSIVYAQAHDGAADKLGPIPNLANLLPGISHDDWSVPVLVDRQGILINSDAIKPETDLKSWNDLLGPKFKGQIIADDMRVAGQGGTFFSITYRQLGRAFHEGLAKQDLAFSRDVSVNIQRVAQKDHEVYIPLAGQYFAQANGLPVRLWVPQEGAPFYTDGLQVLSHAPHPNAARVLINYLLDPRTQAVCAVAGIGPSVKNVQADIPPMFRDLLNSKLMGEDKLDPASLAEVRAAAKEIYK